MDILFQPFQFGPFQLKNRVAMASMTRCRADPKDGNPNDIMVEYYRQRAETAGLVLTECGYTKKEQNSFPGAGGFETEENAHGWKRVVDAVHKEGAVIFAQIYHPGRSLHPEMWNSQPIAPSSIAIQGQTHVKGAKKDHVAPKEATEEDIQDVLNQFENSARIAKLAGFDGIELHGANGYLVDSFLRSGTNKRTDKWGGTIQNRCRFCLEVIDRFLKVYPPDRVGIKISPVGRYQSMRDDDPLHLYGYLLNQLCERKILYVQIAEAEVRAYIPVDNGADQIENCAKALRPYYKGFIMTNGFKVDKEGARRIHDKEADLVSYATNFIANPDLVLRLKNGWPLAAPDPKLFYAPGPVGYCDYPKYSPAS